MHVVSFCRSLGGRAQLAGGQLLTLAIVGLLPLAPATAQQTVVTGPTGSGAFGTALTILTNGNYVVTDPSYDAGGLADIGAVYLYNGTNHTIISTLTGTQASDQVGSGGVTALTGGGFVVTSPNWDGPGAVTNVGAVTWGSGTAGIAGSVSAANSLVGTQANDNVGSSGVMALTNGNYLVLSSSWDGPGAVSNVGAVTWGNGAGGTVGAVDATNSLVGTQATDNLGNTVPTVLSNGNYVIRSPNWDGPGAVSNVGAATWGNGAGSTVGAIDATNSLVGTQASDQVGSGGVIVLTNGHYVVRSTLWDLSATITNAGAATWGNGTGGTVGAVDATNSLVGSQANDNVGTSGILALTNGHYVVLTANWDGPGTVSNVGAATWGNGAGSTVGAIDATNSLVGTLASDQVGSGGGVVLSNGHYVVRSPLWDSPGAVADVGAATWGNGTGGTVGAIDATNSLVGTQASDQVSGSGVTALTNGHYVVRNALWDGPGAVSNVGAATWANGTGGTVGAVSAANSLVGTQATDQVGSTGVALSNGHYVVLSSSWDSPGAVSNVGAATWGNGTGGTVGAVDATNSLVGTQASDQVGFGGVTVLSNGNYVVLSSNWDGPGAVSNVGAATWASGTGSTVGAVDATNSLVGTTSLDQVSSQGVVALSNGNYVVRTTNWDGPGAVSNVGAVTWGNGRGGTVGAVSAVNSLVGTQATDQVGSSSVTALSNGQYIVRSPIWNNGGTADAGAITLGSGRGAPVGTVNSCNSSIGTIASQGSTLVAAYNPVTDQLFVGRPAENLVTAGVGAPRAPTGSTNRAFIAGQTVADLTATGTDVQWYSTSGQGTPLASNTPLADNTFYYASQTVGGCESLSRLAVAVGNPLPVTLVSFTAQAQGPATVRLAWATASEKNSAHFEVERSTDGKTFVAIGEVAAAGSSTAPRAYGLPDTHLPAGAATLYYRLRQVDADGTFSYSPVRVVTVGGKAPLALYPNPARTAVAVGGLSAGASVQVLDALGRTMASGTAEADGTARLALPAGSPAGLYVVRSGGQALRLTVE